MDDTYLSYPETFHVNRKKSLLNFVTCYYLVLFPGSVSLPPVTPSCRVGVAEGRGCEWPWLSGPALSHPLLPKSEVCRSTEAEEVV